MRIITLWVLVVVLVPVLFSVILNKVTSMPVVHFSYESDECVEVRSPDKNHSCDNLPSRYHHVWVQ